VLGVLGGVGVELFVELVEGFVPGGQGAPGVRVRKMPQSWSQTGGVPCSS
jgi:hypothetical protein